MLLLSDQIRSSSQITDGRITTPTLSRRAPSMTRCLPPKLPNLAKSVIRDSVARDARDTIYAAASRPVHHRSVNVRVSSPRKRLKRLKRLTNVSFAFTHTYTLVKTNSFGVFSPAYMNFFGKYAKTALKTWSIVPCLPVVAFFRFFLYFSLCHI